MKDVVLVPAWSRPEMLHYCLDRLSKATGIDACEVWVLIDEHHGFRSVSGQLDTVIDSFPLLRIKTVRRNPHTFHGNSMNVLTGMKDAFSEGASHVFLVEEDVMVAQDFFLWHRAVMNQEKLFCSIAVKCQRRTDAPTDDDARKFWTSGSDYASLGVCLPRESLRAIVCHARDEYFRGQASYIGQNFRDSRFGKEYHEQDGLILRIMGNVNGLSAWPCVPRAWHSGFWGYNRSDRIPFWSNLGLADKIKYCGQALENPDALKKLAGPYQDVFAPDDRLNEWKTLQLAGRLP